MNKILQEIRDNIWCRAWEENKKRITMKELAEILNCSLKTLYRVLLFKGRKTKIKDK